jgi:hypothetical protein
MKYEILHPAFLFCRMQEINKCEGFSMDRKGLPRKGTGWKGWAMTTALTVMVLTVIVFAGCGGADEAAVSMETRNAAEGRAKRATEKLTGTLMGEVQKKIEEVGLAGTVTHCASRAQELSTLIGTEEGVVIRRVTEKTRNPLDAPDSYERRILSLFDAMARRGEINASTVHVEVVRENGISMLRFLKPITIKKACLGCHGPKDSITPEVRQTLRENYPSDMATGYNEGDLRGAVSVLVKLEE